MSELEKLLASQFKILGLPEPEQEVRFAAEIVGLGKGVRQRLNQRGWKDWRFDFLFRRQRLAVEVHGGTFVRGAHSRGMHQNSDFQKLNAAQLNGYRVLQFDNKMVKNWEGAKLVEKVLGGQGAY